jgi:hypothetical protein
MNQLVGTPLDLERMPVSSISISPLEDLPKMQRRKYEGACPSCNIWKKLTHTFNRTAAAVAIIADAAAFLQFEHFGVGLHKDPPCCFRVCASCYKRFKCALEVARTQVGDVEELKCVHAMRTNNPVEQKLHFRQRAKNSGDHITCVVFKRCVFLLIYLAVVVSQVDLFCDVGNGVRAL